MPSIHVIDASMGKPFHGQLSARRCRACLSPGSDRIRIAGHAVTTP
ncbi:hypothetical protein P9314_21250 [Paenibacillus validus]|uniref:Uncharacterized protein n=1 Tax=Paenibacillus validus TaxID=44253 RepID=A0A7X3CW09_9BACL|nr:MULTISPECIES: hypothetical protein [Paenibacillus]MED4603153.1 hypothetical protein [Paenibacillus validus]MED4609313.1 hypothetical protein [Paenibacillus validus]MUG73722.1 hypothetical protein [Paenibacillus validus]